VPGVTGIELGPDCCVLVRGGRLGAHRTVAAAATIGTLAFSTPRDRPALVEQLREARRNQDLPTRARVVAWGDESSVAPLVEAGFDVGAVLTPAQALARVVRPRIVDAAPGTAVAALSLNTHGAVVAIVSGTEVVHSRTFEWSLGTPFTGARSELLDRYLIVSQIAPQLAHVIELVRPVYGVTVTTVVACGNLPNLRSLAMLLIEEMDLEVETLDSDELLDPSMASGATIENIPSLQLAAAVASPGETPRPASVDPEPVRHSLTQNRNETTAPTRSGTRRLQSLTAVAAVVLCAVWSALQVSGTSPAMRVFPNGVDLGERLAVSTPLSAPELQTEATSGATEAIEARPVASAPPRSASGNSASRQRPASIGPLPSVDGILIAGDRRLAIVGGEVVAAGDVVGVRAVSRIERDGVVLREPSGREIYVAIRPRRPPSLGS
jgi:hypothetical protein